MSVKSDMCLSGNVKVENSFNSESVLGKPSILYFQDMWENFMKNVVDWQRHAGESIEKLTATEIKDVNQVSVALENAEISLELMMQIRTRMINIYSELIKAQVGILSLI